ncbi:hypothetical protein ACWD6R_02805 [Streptomyces sp. NPDC005151]
MGDRVGSAFSGFQSLEVVLPGGVDGGAGGLIDAPPFRVAVGPMRGGPDLLVDRPSFEVGLDAGVEGAAVGEEAIEGDAAVPLECEPELQPIGRELCRSETGESAGETGVVQVAGEVPGTPDGVPGFALGADRAVGMGGCSKSSG